MQMENNKGITLVALIITIVVLLILAAVAIGAVRESSIIEYSKNTTEEHDKKKKEEQGILIDYEEMILEVSGTKVTYTEEGIPVPIGFKVVEGTKDTGLVIESKTESSQFVWVPVTTPLNADGYGVGTTSRREPDVITQVYDLDEYKYIDGADKDPNMLEKAGLTVDLNEDGIINEKDFKEQLTNEYKAMVASVNHYGGFYVGRYEVSISGGKAQSKGSTVDVPIYSVTPATTTSADTWYGMYRLCKTYNTNSVKSSMIWGSQYDAMMTWMGTDASSFDTSKRNTDMERRTGIVETDKIRNVYDLGGNCREWTLEAFNTHSRNARSGFFGYSFPLSHRNNLFPTNCTNYDSSRLALYIEL